MASPFSLCGVHPVLDDPSINCTFDDILRMSDDAFVAYVTHMRQTFLHHWNKSGLPPRRGWSEDDVQNEFRQLAGMPVHEFWVTDDTQTHKIIHNTYNALGNAVNAWNAGRMYRTRINYTEKDDGKSIYDFFAKPELFRRYLPYARRHFLRDSFYLFAQSVLTGSSLPHSAECRPDTGFEYIRAFRDIELSYGTHGLLLEPIHASKSGSYSGYGAKLQANAPLRLSFDEYQTASSNGWVSETMRRNITAKHLTSDYVFHVRQYKTGERLFPALFRSFRISMCQYAVNFPPLAAKLLYETYLKHVDSPDVYVWDPSSGWAGRLLGAMAFNRQLPSGQLQHMHYFGTDPNSEFYAENTSVYNAIRDYYNAVRIGESMFDEPHTASVLQLGSEDFTTTPTFQTLEGHGDLVFTSPPYFNREGYSEDPAQSYKKFSAYADWRDGFLAPTIETAYRFLAPNRYFLWNIADIKVGKKYLPLEADSRAIAERCGFEFKETVCMALASMPGANRIDESGTGTAKNTVKMGGRVVKYEPIHVFWEGSK